MNLEWYYTFLKVAQYENYRKASEELFVTQTTVFNHIKNLESFLNIKLFEPFGRNIILTNDGKSFLDIAGDMISTYEKGLSKIKDINKYSYTLNIAVSTYVATYLIPKFLPYFFDTVKNINVSLSVVDQSLSYKIREGRYDIGITGELNGLSDVFHRSICEGKVKLFVPDVAETKNIHDELEYFKKYRIFCGNNTVYWKKLQEDIYKLVPESDFCSISSITATENLVKLNQGISYLPTYIFKGTENKNVKFINSKYIEEPYSETFVVWKNENREIKLFLDRFAEFIENEQKDF